MARSNSRDFSLTRNNLIKRAFHVTNIYDLTASIPNEEMNFAADMLNAMVKEWQAENIHLWNRREGTLFTDYQTHKYSLGSTGDHATADTYISTLINGALAVSATTVVVDSTAGMTAGDQLGITSTDSTRQWTTITSVDDSTTLTVPALAKAVADNARVVSYTNKINRPLLILNARYGKLSDDSEIALEAFRRNDYFELSDKKSNGIPNRYYYDKQLDNGTLYLYQRPDNTDYIINFSYYDEVEDLDSATDDFDYPQEWTLALIWGLAEQLAVSYNLYAELQFISQQAMQHKMIVSNFNYDEESIFIKPDRSS